MFLTILTEGIINGSAIALVAIGVSLIWGVMGILNFAQGDFLMIGMYIGFFMYTLFGWDPLFTLPLAAAALFVIGLLTYKLLIRPVLKAPVLSQRLITFALSLVVQNLALMFFSAKFRTAKSTIFSGTLKFLGVTVSWAKIIPFIVCIVLAVLLYIFINKTRSGKAVRATAMDKDAAALVGIDSEKTFSLAFALSCSITGAAGCIMTYFFYIYPQVGSTFQLFAFIAVAMGGFGNIIASLLGGMIMGVIDTATGVYVSTAFKYVAVCLMYILVVFFRPDGIFTRRKK